MLSVWSPSIQQRLGQIPAYRIEVSEEEVMSSHFIGGSNNPAPEPSSRSRGSALHGALVGLIPLGFLIVLVIVALLLTALARQLVAASGFFVQQQAAVIVLIIGLVLALIVYIIAIVFTLRSVSAWQQDGAVGQARSALWAVGVTVLVVILPVLLALVLPQNPAP